MKNKSNSSWKSKIIIAVIALIIAVSGGTRTLSDHSDASYSFRNSELRESHFEKHGKEMGYSSAEEYEEAAGAVVTNKASLHKTEKEDGDDVYYLEETNEFVIVSTDGYLRTYFLPDSGIDYYNRQ